MKAFRGSGELNWDEVSGVKCRKEVPMKPETWAKGTDYKILECHAKELDFMMGKWGVIPRL